MKIGLLTCEKLPNLSLDDQFLIPKLAKHNISADALVWDNPDINWSDYDYLLFRTTWDYFEKEEAFNIWLKKIEELGIKTFNSIKTINQNKHKFYLRDLQNQGIKIIPTIFIDKTNALNLSEMIPKSWKKIVIKPAFSGGAYLTELFDIEDVEKINTVYKNIAIKKELLLQEYMPEINTIGESSFIFFNKKFSHSINKKPIENDFRVQVQFGGQYTSFEPNSELLKKAQKIVDTFSESLLYTRVDGIVIDNEIHLMEVECIEPDLYFNFSDGSQERFVDSILELIN